MSQRTFTDVVRDTHKSKDDLRWERQQRSKRRKPEPPVIPDGPCCGQCRYWLAPGECRMALVVTKGGAKGTVLTIAEYDVRVVPINQIQVIEPLRTAAHFQCTQFADQSTDLATEIIQ